MGCRAKDSIVPDLVGQRIVLGPTDFRPRGARFMDSIVPDQARQKVRPLVFVVNG